MTKVFSINGDGDLFCDVMKDKNDSWTPYRIYRVWWDTDANGYPKKHRELIQRYSDLASVLCFLRDDALGIAKTDYGVSCKLY